MNENQTDAVRAVKRSYRIQGCGCHPMSEEDARIWQIVKKLPRTKAQWERLHNLIEHERRMLIDDYKGAR